MEILRRYPISFWYSKAGTSLLTYFADVDSDGIIEGIFNLRSADFVCVKPDGTEVWRRTSNGTSDKGAYFPKITPDGTALCYGHRGSNTVYCVNLSDGTVRWSVTHTGVVSMERCAAGLIVGGGTTVDILDYTTGASVGGGWPLTFSQHEQLLSSGMLGGEEVVAVNDNAGNISIRRTADATQVFALSSDHTHVDSSFFCDLLGSGNNVYVTVTDDDGSLSPASEGDEIRVYDATGTLVTSFQLDHGSPAMAIGKFRDDYTGLQIVFSTENSTDISMLGISSGNLVEIWATTLPAIYTTATALGQIIYGDFDDDGSLEFAVNLGELNGSTDEGVNNGFIVYDAYGNQKGLPIWFHGWDFDPRQDLSNGNYESTRAKDWLSLGYDQLLTKKVGADNSAVSEVVHLLDLKATESFNSLFGLGSHTADASLVGWWLLQDDAANTTIVDSHGSDSGALSSGNTSAASVAGPNGYLTKALNFDGVDDRIGAITPAINSANMTLFAWGRNTSGARGDLVSIQGNDATYKFSRLAFNEATANSGTAAFNIRLATASTGITATSADINTDDGLWHFAAGVKTNNDCLVFADELPRAVATTASGFAEFTTTELAIGCLRRAGSNAIFFGGDIAGVGLLSRPLIPDYLLEIKRGPEPINSVAPAISGTESVGSTLTATSGTWGLDALFSGGTNGTITYAYQWTRSDDGSGTGEVDISSATSSTYTLQVADETKFIRCRVRASNTGGYDPDADTNSAFSGEIAAASSSFNPAWARNSNILIGM